MLPRITKHIIAAWEEKKLGEGERLVMAMNGLATGDLLNTAIKDILQDNKALAKVARRSFRHPTGAAKIVLSDLGPDMPELRLHCWPQAINRDGNEFSVHNHRWAFCSRVLRGHLVHEIFEEHESGFPHHAIDFSAYDASKIYRAEEHQGGRIRIVDKFEIGPGDQYYMAENQLHRMTNANRAMAVTLFLRGPYRLQSTIVFHEKQQAILTGQYPPGLASSVVIDLLSLISNMDIKDVRN